MSLQPCPGNTHTPVACGAWQELLTSQNVAPCWAQEMYSSLLAVYKSSICLPDLNHAQPRIIRMKLPKMPTYSHISIIFQFHAAPGRWFFLGSPPARSPSFAGAFAAWSKTQRWFTPIIRMTSQGAPDDSSAHAADEGKVHKIVDDKRSKRLTLEDTIPLLCS